MGRSFKISVSSFSHFIDKNFLQILESVLTNCGRFSDQTQSQPFWRAFEFFEVK